MMDLVASLKNISPEIWASWVSAIGTFLATVVALWLGVRQPKAEVRFSMNTPEGDRHELTNQRDVYLVCGRAGVFFEILQKYSKYENGTVRINSSSFADAVAPYSKTRIGGALKRTRQNESDDPVEVGIIIKVSGPRYHHRVRLYMGQDTDEKLVVEMDSHAFFENTDEQL